MSRDLNKLQAAGLRVGPADGDHNQDGKSVRSSDEIYTGQNQSSSGTFHKMAEIKKDSVVHDVLVLVAITLAAGLLLGASYSITRAPIAASEEAQRTESQKAVMKDADSFSTLESLDEESIASALSEAGITNTEVEEIDEALDSSGSVIGYVVTTDNSEGYGGDIELMTGVSISDGGNLIIEGISFLTITETAGMGMRAKESSFTDQFAGKLIENEELVEYTKSGAEADNEIDAISGCTITTSAVTKDVNAALVAVRTIMEVES